MIARILVGLISLYQRRGGGQRLLVECNYTPSCSEYAKTAIERFGVRAGVGLAIARIRRCNDRNRFQKIHDPVPVSLPEYQRHARSASH